MPKFEKEVEIDAPIEKVWEVITDTNKWPQWFPGIDSVSNVKAISAGGTFEWVDDGKTAQGTIVAMEPLKYLEIMTQLGDDKDLHKFNLRSSGGFFGLANDECKVEYILDTLMGGGILGKFVAGGNPKDTLRVKKAMHNLRKLVESS
ncbi:MAG: SRPBCC family protein [Anaerolineaceae bacterium]|nr:SRPBCC family protein [Anaerolineaceae bacterium]